MATGAWGTAGVGLRSVWFGLGAVQGWTHYGAGRRAGQRAQLMKRPYLRPGIRNTLIISAGAPAPTAAPKVALPARAQYRQEDPRPDLKGSRQLSRRCRVRASRRSFSAASAWSQPGPTHRGSSYQWLRSSSAANTYPFADMKPRTQDQVPELESHRLQPCLRLQLKGKPGIAFPKRPHRRDQLDAGRSFQGARRPFHVKHTYGRRT